MMKTSTCALHETDRVGGSHISTCVSQLTVREGGSCRGVSSGTGARTELRMQRDTLLVLLVRLGVGGVCNFVYLKGRS